MFKQELYVHTLQSMNVQWSKFKVLYVGLCMCDEGSIVALLFTPIAHFSQKYHLCETCKVYCVMIVTCSRIK